MADKFSAYADPNALVSTDWVIEHLDDPNVRIVESNEDLLLYDTGHVPGAVHIDWRRDLNDQTVRDYVDPAGFTNLCRRNGITPDTAIVFYGDKSNWWSCYAYWVFQLFGHRNAKVMDGGRDKWAAENRETTRDIPTYPESEYPEPAKHDNESIRAFFAETLAHANAKLPMGDVRSPGEYSGEVTHMPDYPQEGVLRGGHIPGAKSCPWARAANEDGTFKSAEELRAIYTVASSASTPRTTSSLTAASVSAQVTPGLSSPDFSVLKRCAITMEAGPNGATWSARPSRRTLKIRLPSIER